MSPLRPRLSVLAGLVVGALILSGCGRSSETVVTEPPSDSELMDAAAEQAKREKALETYDPGN